MVQLETKRCAKCGGQMRRDDDTWECTLCSNREYNQARVAAALASRREGDHQEEVMNTDSPVETKAAQPNGNGQSPTLDRIVFRRDHHDEMLADVKAGKTYKEMLEMWGLGAPNVAALKREAGMAVKGPGQKPRVKRTAKLDPPAVKKPMAPPAPAPFTLQDTGDGSFQFYTITDQDVIRWTTKEKAEFNMLWAGLGEIVYANCQLRRRNNG